jgi:hypothetical protein
MIGNNLEAGRSHILETFRSLNNQGLVAVKASQLNHINGSKQKPLGDVLFLKKALTSLVNEGQVLAVPPRLERGGYVCVYERQLQPETYTYQVKPNF